MENNLSLTCKTAAAGLFGASLVFMTAQADLAKAADAKVFDTPEAAAAALVHAAKAKASDEIFEILGPESRQWIVSGDAVQDEEGRANFVAAAEKTLRIEKDDQGNAILVIGDDFPFPIPIAKVESGWAFDAEAGQEEILDRRIGENELNAIQVLLAIADAEQDYAEVDWDGDGLREYAARFSSTEGEYDGLFWPDADNVPLSPLGPLIAEAAAEGYEGDRSSADFSGDGATPTYHGYRYRLLTRQGPGAPGGAYDYLVNGNMVGGFAILAFPANYDNSGTMTFAVSHDGKVYEADFGPETEKLALAIEAFDPNEDWQETKVEEAE